MEDDYDKFNGINLIELNDKIKIQKTKKYIEKA